MLLIPVLALAIHMGQTPDPGPTVRLGDREVALNWITPASASMPTALVNWKGWGYLKGNAANWTGDFVQGEIAPAVPDVKPVATFKLKVIILAQRFVETDSKPAGLRRYSMPDYAIDEQLQSIARDTEYLRAAFKGLVQIDADVEVRKTTLIEAPSVPSENAAHWISARLNGYGYEADDKVKRGPFHWVEVRYAGLPYSSLCERALDHVLELAREKGYKTNGDSATIDPVVLKDVFSFKPASKGDFQAHGSQNFSVELTSPSARTIRGAKAENIGLDLVDDSEHGKVLRFTEHGYYRYGGLTLPGGFNGHKKLTFFMKSDSKDPLAVYVVPEAGTATKFEIGNASAPASVPFRYDATWQQVSVPLPSAGSKIARVMLAGPLGDERQQLKNPAYQFDDFQLLDDDSGVTVVSPAPELDSPLAGLRLAALKKYSEAPTADLKDKAFKLLDDKDDEVRLEAIRVFASDPAAESKLIEDVFHIDGFICEAAINALVARNSDLGWAQIRTALAPGTPLRRIAAARALAAKGDPKIAGPISGLIGDPDPSVREAAALSISSLPGDEPPKIISVFFNDVDPAVVASAEKASNPDNPLVARRLQYLSVNDPWDSVRLQAYLKLAGCKDPEVRKEGWKGSRDDSALVRSQFIELAPDAPELALVLKAAFGDSNPLVRASVVRRMSSDPKYIGAVDSATLGSEFAPSVISLLIDRASALNLPPAVVESLRASAKGPL